MVGSVGGIMTSFNASISLVDCKVGGNKGWVGAGIYNRGSLVLEDCIISGNAAIERGGAIFNTGAGRVEITNTSFTGNAAPEGANVFNEAPGTVIYHVDDDRGESIQDTIDNAPSGSFINVAPGLYPENLHIDQSLTITGSGDTIVGSMGIAPVITIGEDSWQVQQFKRESVSKQPYDTEWQCSTSMVVGYTITRSPITALSPRTISATAPGRVRNDQQEGYVMRAFLITSQQFCQVWIQNQCITY
jgi:hypothetical protein